MTEHPIYACSLPEAKILADLHSIAYDLELIRNMLEKVPYIEDDTIISSAILAACLITYRRCFNSGTRRWKLGKNDILKLPHNAHIFHDHFYSLSNKLVAHALTEEVKIGTIVSNNEVKGIAQLTMKFIQFDTINRKNWIKLITLIENNILFPLIKTTEQKVLIAVQATSINEITSAPPLQFKSAELNTIKKRHA